MGRKAALSLLLVTAFLALPAALNPSAAQAEPQDEAFIQTLIEGSPWEGTWRGSAFSGTSSTSFHRDAQGRLQGELLASSVKTVQPGPLQYVEVKKGTLTYTSPAGTGMNFVLKLAPDGRLVGTYDSGRRSGTMEMSRSK